MLSIIKNDYYFAEYVGCSCMCFSFYKIVI